ncbi:MULTISPECIES: tyrosine-protein phosphatase [unclassified Microbacterium]|uniref:tyrosine-protein phosphatase n=1 Tax=unclassified Microbacterium TaxID=2609290 RepID=UPI00214CF150|nr:MULTISPECIES: tyrosine-protein phosphatase [unclassified Microbacterium]MCR2785295.1 tyrosine-protein phosphatase [Microbacterium sp. zg.B96]WIM16823.1 tyrosine-protein phosphatase [Microbacterium sp. zg-B96]
MTDAGWVVSGALNFRDVGGLPAGSGVTRSGVLFRSGNLARLDEGGRATLRELGLRRVIDLRADDEIAREPSLLDGLSVQTLRVPLFLGSAASFFERDVGLDDFYRTMLDEAADRVVDVVRGVLADQPVLVHCTVGKDRTGVTVALTLAAAGVDEEAVVADYARTEVMLPAQRNARVLAYLRSQHPEAQFLEELATKSPAAAMRTLLEGLRAQYGAPVEFLRAHGLTDDEIAELARVLVRRD